MLRITTSAQGAAGMPAGARSTDPGLTNFQRAQLRAQEQGSAGGQMQAYGSLSPNSNTNQYRAALGAPAVTAQTANGMTTGGQAQATSNPLAGSNAMQPAVQPGGATLGQPQPRQPYMGQQPPAGNQAGGAGFMPNPNGLPEGPGSFAATSGFAPSQGFGPTASYGGAAAGQTPTTGLTGAEQAYMGGLGNGIGAVNQSLGMARNDVAGATQGANSTLNPYYQAGAQSNNTQAAMSGALGNAAQQQAMDGFMSSPGQQYLLDESERAIARNAAATGGLGGGNVQRALQQNAIGLAAQDFDNAFNRMGTVSDRGLAAGGQISGNQMTSGNLLSGLAQNAGNMNANMMYGTGQNLASGRTRAGELIGQNIADSSTNLANIVSQSGVDQSGVMGQGASNLAALLSGAGKDSATINSQLAQLLAGISTGAGGQQAGVGSVGGTSQTGGWLTGMGNAASGIGALLASDKRLKENIRQVGSINGVNLYEWDWNEEGKRIAGGQSTYGVIAQEVPHAAVMADDGYLRVDYARVW